MPFIFPYTNFHEINLDWILKELKRLETPATIDPEYLPEKCNIFNVKDYGALGDGMTDDTDAIKAVIAMVPENGGIIYFPPGVYIINDTLVVGDGTHDTNSKYNGITIMGAGNLIAGTAVYYNLAGTVFKWVGAASKAMMEIHGPINGLRISNLTFDGNQIADYGLRIFCSQWGEYSRITIANCNKQGLGLEQWANQSRLITTNNIYNRFSQIQAYCPWTGNATCIYIGSDPDNEINDSNMNSWENISVYRHPGGNGIHIDFSDASNMRNVIVWCNGATTTGHDILLDGTVKTRFPTAYLFENISATIDTVGTIGMITVLGYGMGDGESLPADTTHIRGWTHDGYTFGTWTPAP